LLFVTESVMTGRYDLLNAEATTWLRDVTERRLELSILSVLLLRAAALTGTAAAVQTAAGEVAVAAVNGHLRDACGVHHGGLTTPELVTWHRWSTDRDNDSLLPHTQRHSDWNYRKEILNLYCRLCSGISYQVSKYIGVITLAEMIVGGVAQVLTGELSLSCAWLLVE